MDRMAPAGVRTRPVAGYQLAVGAALALLVSGCSSVGPPLLARDRFDYSSAVADSWKRQTLLKGKPGGVRTMMFFGRAALTERERQEIEEVRRLLQIHPEANEFELVFGPTAASDREIAVQTRSLVQILLEVRGQVSVPAEHIAEGRASKGLADPDGAEIIRYMGIHSSRERSPEAFLSVPYRTTGSGSTTGTLRRSATSRS